MQIAANDYSNDTLQATSRLLARNPEYYTIWNHRRILLEHVFKRELTPDDDEPADAEAIAIESNDVASAQHEVELLIKEDLQFLIPLLREYPKCYWIWNHRSWLLATATEHLPSQAALALWQGELALVSKMLSLDSRNFHGWGYRRKVVSEVERISDSSMVEAEFDYTTKMIQSNLSNFSAWHNRSRLMSRLLIEREANSTDRRKLLDAELELITRALYTDPYDQSLWFYHQFLMSTLQPLGPALSILKPCTQEERARYLEQEIDSVREMLDGAEDCKYIYQALLEYSTLHVSTRSKGLEATKQERAEWLNELKKIDPLRSARWADLEQ